MGSIAASQLLVSLEGLPWSCRDVLLKSVQAGLGASVATTSDPPASAACAIEPTFSHTLCCLLQRMRALRKLSHFPVVVFQGTWVDKIPEHPVLRKLYAELARALAPTESRHLMIFLRSSPHEAFEMAVRAGAEAKDLSLRGLLALQQRLDRLVHPGLQACHPFQLVQYHYQCPPFMADHAPALLSSAETLLAAVASELKGGGGGPVPPSSL